MTKKKYKFMEIIEKEWVQYLLVFISMIALVFIWYPNNSWEVLMGDDLIAITGFKNNGFWGTLLNPENVQLGKIRPVSTIILYAIYLIGGTSYTVYYLINRICLSLMAFFIFYMLRKMELRGLYALIVSVLSITTPFSAYAAWQMIGICEIVSVFGVLCSIIFMYKIIYSDVSKETLKNVIWCTVAFAIVVFNAERFMYLFVIYAFIVLLKKNMNFLDKFYSCLFLFIPVLARTVIITMAGGSSFNTGRAASEDLLTTLVQYTIRGFVNLFGFSIGDQWHGGFEIWQIPNWILIISSIFVFVSLGMLFACLEKWFTLQKYEYLFVIFLFALALSSLFSYALVGSTHGEDRFLWLSYIALCMGIVYYLSTCEVKRYLKALVIVFFLVLIAENHYYIENKYHTHFRYSQEMAQTCYDNVSALIGEGKTIEVVCCVKQGDYPWVFYGQSFFDYYFDESIEVLYFDSFEMVNEDELPENTVIVYPDENYPIPYGVTACWIKECKQIQD